MSVFKRLLNFYLESSIHVALAVVSLTVMTYYEMKFRVDLKVLGFVFFGSITGYNLIKYAPIAGLHHRSLTNHLRAIQIFSGFAFLATCYYFFEIPFRLKVFSILLGLLTTLYVLPFYGTKNLRNLSGVKIYIVGLVWAGVTVLLPYFEYETHIGTDVIILFVQRFLWVIVLTLPFEIRDLIYDRRELGTIPQQLGIKMTKGLGIGLLVLMVVLEGFKNSISLRFYTLLVLFVCLTALMLILSKPHKPRVFTAFWVEAIPIFWLLSYMFSFYLFNS